MYNINRLKVYGNKTLFVINKFMNKILILLTIFLFSASCATPTVVNVIGPNDNEMNCKQLSNEIEIANQYAEEAQQAKKAGFA